MRLAVRWMSQQHQENDLSTFQEQYFQENKSGFMVSFGNSYFLVAKTLPPGLPYAPHSICQAHNPVVNRSKNKKQRECFLPFSQRRGSWRSAREPKSLPAKASLAVAPSRTRLPMHPLRKRVTEGPRHCQDRRQNKSARLKDF